MLDPTAKTNKIICSVIFSLVFMYIIDSRAVLINYFSLLFDYYSIHKGAEAGLQMDLLLDQALFMAFQAPFGQIHTKPTLLYSISYL